MKDYFQNVTICVMCVHLDVVCVKHVNCNMKKKYFHEVIEEEEKILAIGLKQSRLHKKERLDREIARWPDEQPKEKEKDD